MGTSIGGAIDYLLTGRNKYTGTTLLENLQVVESSVVLADNEPMVASQFIVVIGRQQIDNGGAAVGTAVYAEMGATRITESYNLDCYIQGYMEGPEQKPVRDKVVALFDAVVHWVHADPTLGLLLQQGRIGLVSSFQLLQTQDENDSADGALRTAEIQLSLQIQNHYLP